MDILGEGCYSAYCTTLAPYLDFWTSVLLTGFGCASQKRFQDKGLCESCLFARWFLEILVGKWEVSQGREGSQ